MKAAPGHQAVPPQLDRAAVLEAFRRARRRRLFLDYDGTLIGFFRRPEDAAPSPALCEILARLAAEPQNDVLVISGRARPDLDRWLGGIPGLWLAAEHGAFLRPPGADWRTPSLCSLEWKDRVRPLLRDFVDRTPGSFIEEKEYALVWHFRNSDPHTAEPRATELEARIGEALADSGVRAMSGRKIVEIKPDSIHKGTVVELMSLERGPAEFQFAAGDDRTDEDLFAALPPDSWTVRVGPGRSAARYAVAGPVHITGLLRDLSSSCTEGIDISPRGCGPSK